MRLTTSPLYRAECHEIWEPKAPGTLWATPGLLRDSFTFTLLLTIYRVVQEKSQYSVIILSIIVRKEVNTKMCLILNGYQVRAV